MAYVITLTGANSGPTSGYLRPTAQGSIDPVYANIDQTSTTLGAQGQFEQFRSVQDEGTMEWTTMVTFVGVYADADAIPFTSMTRDSIEYPKVEAAFSTDATTTTLTWSNKEVTNGAFVLEIFPGVTLSEFWTNFTNTQEII